MAVSTALEICQLDLIYGLLSLCSLFCKQSQWTRTRSNFLKSHSIVVLVKSYWVTLTTFKCAKTYFVRQLKLLKTRSFWQCVIRVVLVHKVFQQKFPVKVFEQFGLSDFGEAVFWCCGPIKWRHKRSEFFGVSGEFSVNLQACWWHCAFSQSAQHNITKPRGVVQLSSTRLINTVSGDASICC